MSVRYRPYQEESIDRIMTQWDLGRDTLLVMATGGGKTIVFLGLLDRVLQPGQRALIIAHRKELIEQPIERMRQHFPRLARDAGIVMANRNECDKQVIVATVQTLASDGRLDAILEHGPIDYLVIDEAHHAVADTYKNVIDRLKCPPTTQGNARTGLRHLGVTATPIRADDQGLIEVYDSVAAKYDIRYLVKHGYLCPPRWLGIKTRVSLKGISKNGTGPDRDFSPTALREVFETSSTFDLIVETHERFAQDRPTIAFTATVDGAHELAAAFNAAGFAAAAADANTPKNERADILNRFRQGELQILCNVGLWTEGLDLPEISCVHMARPTQSDAYYMQCIGRALRVLPGKEDAVVLDYAPADERNIVFLGDVLGAPASRTAYLNEDVEEGEAMGGFTWDGGFKWMEDSPMEIISRKLDYLNLSPFKWSQYDKGGPMVLGLGEGSDGLVRTLVVTSPAPEMELWGVTEQNYRQEAWLIARGGFGEIAQRAEEIADKWAVGVLSQKKKRWRRAAPSIRQLNYARRLGIDPTGMTRGDVAEAITYNKAISILKREGVQL